MGEKKVVTTTINKEDYIKFINISRDRSLTTGTVLRQAIKKFIEETNDSIDFLFNR